MFKNYNFILRFNVILCSKILIKYSDLFDDRNINSPHMICLISKMYKSLLRCDVSTLVAVGRPGEKLFYISNSYSLRISSVGPALLLSAL